MPKVRYIFASLALLSLIPAQAQYDQSISVEGKYVPEFIPQDRIGLFPQTMKFPTQKSSLTYATEGVDADFTPQAIPIEATGWQDTRTYSRKRGYLDLGAGSWLESTLSAGYRFIDTSATTFGIRLQHNSSSLWQPKVSEAMAKTFMRRYDESAALYASHSFGEMGRLDAAVDYHFGFFNYYGYNPYFFTPAEPAAEAPTQTVNDVAARLEWSSPSRLDDMAWNVAAGVRYLGMRRFYLPDALTDALLQFTGCRETDAYLQGGFSFPISTKSTIGIDLDSHLFNYADYRGRGEIEGTNAPFPTPPLYGTLTLTPYYRFTKNRLNIRAGARVDLWFNARNVTGERYRTFNIAPSVKIDYNAGPVALFLHVLGGNISATMSRTYDTEYYCIPAIFSTTPSYAPIDSRAGVSCGPFAGFSAAVDVAYNYTFDMPFYGWYQAYINAPASLYNLGLPYEIDGAKASFLSSPGGASNLHGVSVGLSLGYDAGRYFRVDARGSYQPQKGETGYFNGIDRPQWVVSASMSSNPWRSLRLGLSCDYRAKRAFPIIAELAATAQNDSRSEIVMYNVKDWFSLNFRASYQFNDWIGVWVEAANLTNRRNELAPCLPTPGITATAGLNFQF